MCRLSTWICRVHEALLNVSAYNTVNVPQLYKLSTSFPLNEPLLQQNRAIEDFLVRALFASRDDYFFMQRMLAKGFLFLHFHFD